MIVAGFTKNRENGSGVEQPGNETGSECLKNGSNDFLQTHHLYTFFACFSESVSRSLQENSLKSKFSGPFLTFESVCLEKTTVTFFFKLDM